MKDAIIDLFADAEQEKRIKLNQLMADWKKEVSKSKVVFRGDGKAYSGDEYFVSDGFLPNYFTAKTKVLFVAREARWSSGCDFVAGTINKCNGTAEWNINRENFLRRILYIAYGIQHNGKVQFENIPCANDIGAEFAQKNKFGFAIMQMSKYSNDCEDGATADAKLMNDFFETSNLDKRNFLREEVELLEPDVIITANLWKGNIDFKYLELAFGEVIDEDSISDKATLSTATINTKKVHVIDLYHFSAPGKTEKDFYYDPVMKFLFGKKAK